ncbi:hypothetical protein MTO96_040364, partial [Rhipicephalus appendiculatus]
TSTAATFLLYHLAKNPRAQSKAREEAIAVLGEQSNSVEPHQLEKLSFLKACLKESMRLNPSLPGIYRKLDHDVIMSGYVVPAGVPIFVDGFVAGRSEENFSRPDEYIPERWLKTDQEILPHDGYASLPFSFGPRMCLGRRIAELQMCTLVAKILLKYNVEYPREDLEFHGQLINIPKSPTDFSFKKLRPEAKKNTRRAATVASASIGNNALQAKPFEAIPRVPSLPIIGSSWMYWRLLGKHHPDQRHHASMEMYKKYGPIVVEGLPGRYSLLHLFTGSDIRNLFQEEGKVPFRMGATAFKDYRARRPDYYADVGILNLQGKNWVKVRTSTQQHTSRVRTTMAYLPSMNVIAEEALDLLDQLMDEDGKVEDCFTFLQRWSLESVALASVDARLGSLRHPLDLSLDGPAILQDMKIIFACMQKFGYRFPYFRYIRTPAWQRFEKAMDDFTVRIFRHIEAAAQRMTSEEFDHEPTILEHMLREKKLTFGEILTFTSDFNLAGVDTTANTATYLLFHLAKNPRAQSKAREEAIAVLGENCNHVEPHHLERLPFLKACMKESLRFNPSLPGVYRKLDHDVVMSGYRVPAGVPIFMDLYVAGRAEENFSSPELYTPERWLKKDQEILPHDGYGSLPFSFGPRMCLGRRIAELQIFTLITKVTYELLLSYE